MTRLTVIEGGGVVPEQRLTYADRLAPRPLSPIQRQEQIELGIKSLCLSTAHCDVMDLESLQRLRWSASEFHALVHRLERELASQVTG